MVWLCTGVEWEECEECGDCAGRWAGEGGMGSRRTGGGGGWLAATASEGLKEVRSNRRESRSKSVSGGGG